MAVIYRARRRLLLPSGWANPGDDITTQVMTWRHLAAWIHSGRVVLTQTTVTESTKNKQRIPTTGELDWRPRPHRRAFDPASLDPMVVKFTPVPPSGGGGVGPPTLGSVSPATGVLAGGTAVQVNGTGLAGAIALTFGANQATGLSVTATRINATTPAGAATGPVDVTVFHPNGDAKLTAAYTYT